MSVNAFFELTDCREGVDYARPQSPHRLFYPGDAACNSEDGTVLVIARRVARAHGERLSFGYRLGCDFVATPTLPISSAR
jgi:hypothetical protein